MKINLLINSFVLWMLSLGLIPTLPLSAQTKTSLSKPRLEYKDYKLIIGYDFLNYKPQDVFTVGLLVTDSTGRVINASSLSGDIGEGITCGTNKVIVWNIEADRLVLNEEVFVEVTARKMNPEVAETEKTTDENKPATTTKSISKTNMMVSTLVLPGLGQAKARGNYTYIIMGVAGYGCVAGAALMNRRAINTYDSYKAELDIDKRNNLFNQSKRQDNISESLANAAAGIWAVNIIWTVFIQEKSKKSVDWQGAKRINIYPVYDQQLGCTMVSLRYKF